MADNARAFWITAPGRGEIRTEALPSVSAGEVVVRALYSGISRGTEALVFRGRVPASEYERMRAPFQAGDFPGPVKYGYASVGQIEHGPRELQDRIVFALYPHQTRFDLPVEAVVSAYDVPDIYKVPLVFNAQGVDDFILREHFGLDPGDPDLTGWCSAPSPIRAKAPRRSPTAPRPIVLPG